MATPKAACATVFVHEDRVRSARKALRGEDALLDLSEIFKVLGDPTRLKILLALSKETLCVCDLAALLGMTNSAISHQLRLLKNLRLVKYRRTGKMAYYALDDDHVNELITVATRHLAER
jgi:DNA-binding transcriptional ArsR family regulator